MPIVPPDRIDEIVRALRAGQIASIPTDTVYGIAASIDHPMAMRRLPELKGRDTDQPIALLIDSVEAVAAHLDDPTALDRVLRFWPGALTAIVRVRGDSPLKTPVVTVSGEGSKTLGLRQPDAEVARSVIRSCGGALAVTSANRHGEPPATSAAEVAAAFGAAMPVLDGGPRTGGVASTVVDLSVEPPRLLREGPVSAEELGLAVGRGEW